MEKPPYIFGNIVHFTVGNIEKHSPRFEEIEKLTLEVASRLPRGRYPLTLIKPFPPFGRPGGDIGKLRSLCAEDIDSIWVFDKPDDGHWARIEIHGKAPATTFFVKCVRVEGVPGWAGPVHALDGGNPDEAMT